MISPPTDRDDKGRGLGSLQPSASVPTERTDGPAGQSYPASRLCEMASDWLAARYPEALIVREFCVGVWGGALIDLAAITETEIIGLEIKGDGDSPTRLKLQASLYAKAAQRMFLLPAPSIFGRCAKADTPGWRLLAVENGQIIGHGWQANDPPPLLPTAPGQLLQALWKDELGKVAMWTGAPVSPSLGCDGRRAVLAETTTLRALIPAVCRALRERNWHGKGLGDKVRWATPTAENTPAPAAPLIDPAWATTGDLNPATTGISATSAEMNQA